MKWLKNFIDKHPKMKSIYEYKATEWIKRKKEELKSKIPSHTWWEADEIDQNPLEIDEQNKFIIMRNIVEQDVIDSLRNNSCTLRELLNELENIAASLSQNEKNEMEVLFLEGVINISSSEGYYDKLYAVMGPTLRKMCDDNNAFWKGLEKNKENTIS
jgi:hypothetical protein